MQPETIARRFDAVQPGVVADFDPQKLLVPGQIIRPIRPKDAVDGRVSRLPVPRFVPGLETQGRQPDLRPGQRFRRAQQSHPRRVQPNPGVRLIRRRIDDRHLADPRPPQRPGIGASRLPAADQHHVVVDPRAIGHPIRRGAPDQAQRLAGSFIGHAGFLSCRFRLKLPPIRGGTEERGRKCKSG